MKRTGIFYNKICGEQAYFSLAMSVREGFEALQEEHILSAPNVSFWDSKAVTDNYILKIHTKDWLEQVKRTDYYVNSLYSIGGLVQATGKLLKDDLDNALVIIGVGGHHAGRNYAWGGCFFNLTGIAIDYAREKFDARRFAIVDTDTHHGDGTREIFKDDKDVLHICFCGHGGTYTETKVCLPHSNSDEDFIKRLEEEVPYRISKFKPELIYWICGLDTHLASYGTRSLTEGCYPKLAEIIKRVADETCNGKLIVKIGCNAPAYVSEYVMPRLVYCLGELGQKG